MNDTKIKKSRIPDPYVLLFALIIVMALLTYIIPSGQYQQVETPDGRMVVDPDSFAYVEPNHTDVFDVLKAFPMGLGAAQSIIFFIFIIGGSFNIVNQTGAIIAGIGRLTLSLKGKEHLMIPIVVFVFSVGGATIGMSEELIIFVPIGITLSRALGYDAIVGTSIVLMGAVAGFTSGFINPFTVGVAQGIAGLPLFSGIELRIVIWLTTVVLVSVYISVYAKKVKSNPKASFIYDIEHKEKDTSLELTDLTTLNKKQVIVLLVFAMGMIILLLGVFKYEWYLTEISAIFLAIGIVSGLLYGMKLNDLAGSFIEGAKDIAYGALIVGMARGILVIMQDAMILDTIVHGLASAISSFPKAVCALGMLLVQTVLNFIITSGSGLAATTMPIMSPLADVLGITRQTAVLAYQFGDGITNYIAPTSGILMANLALAKIPYEKWVKFIWPLIALWTILGALFVVYASITNYGPF